MDKLDEIMASKRRETAPLLRPVSDRELINLSLQKRRGPTFAEALFDPEQLSVIAEIKRASPSAGIIKGNLEAGEQARLYYNAHADAVSVLTERRFFNGDMRDLWEANDLLQSREDAIPTLRKDFMFHPFQVLESAESSARAILIIVRALSDEEITALFHAAELAGMDCLFEIHEEAELERAMKAGAGIIGVNNRDLTHFETDLAISEHLLPKIPEGVLRISESGIFTPQDAARVRAAGADAVLIGEALMKAEDPEVFIRALHGI